MSVKAKVFGLVLAVCLGVTGLMARAMPLSEGYDDTPCPKCGGSVWISLIDSESFYVDHILCIHGHGKGDDLFYNSVYSYKFKCQDCDGYVDYKTLKEGYWVCHGWD